MKNRFGYEWQKYHKIIPEYKDHLEKWIYPLTLADFKDKEVLDAGCGNGSNAYWLLRSGVKKLIAFDCDMRSVKVTKANLAQFNNVEVWCSSICCPNYKDRFDISFSIGVVHHLERPKLAINTLVRATKPGGTILIWVYGKSWMTKIINPIRKLTSLFPPPVIHLLSYLISIPFFIFTRFPQRTEYLKRSINFSFTHIHSTVFDQLLPRIAYYWTREEALALFDKQGVKNVRIYETNGMSWTVIAEKE